MPSSPKHLSAYYEDLCRGVFNNYVFYQTDSYNLECPRVIKKFYQAILSHIFYVCGLASTENAANTIHQLLKLPIFILPTYRRNLCKKIRYKIIPVLWKDHQAIERKKQKKLLFLANELSKAGRHVEGHIIRTIVKPYICDLNRKWSKMTAVDKLKTVPFLEDLQRTIDYLPPCAY